MAIDQNDYTSEEWDELKATSAMMPSIAKLKAEAAKINEQSRRPIMWNIEALERSILLHEKLTETAAAERKIDVTV
jgi:hypothetical protein